MEKALNKLTVCLLPIFILGITFTKIPFIVVLAFLLIRLMATDRDTCGIFLLMFGGAIGGYVRQKYPFMPVYGLLFQFYGLFLLRNYFLSKWHEKQGFKYLLVLMIYFLLNFALSPNTRDVYAQNKIFGMIQTAVFMYVGYYALIRSHRFNNESFGQLLFLSSILFFVYNMELLGIRPSGLFDYTWFRFSTEGLKMDDPMMEKVINYHIVGMNSLFALSFIISKLDIKKPVLFYYLVIAAQLVLFSGARQAIFGLLLIFAIRYYFKSVNGNWGVRKGKFKYLISAVVLLYLSVSLLEFLDLDYINNTFSEGDEGRSLLSDLAIALFLKYPIFGSGIGGFQHNVFMMYPHNFFLEVLCECGIVGLLLLSCVVFSFIRKYKIHHFYLTRSHTFFFIILIALMVRCMVSADLSYSIQLFSAIFACAKDDRVLY